jgi:hypothetical protein
VDAWLCRTSRSRQGWGFVHFQPSDAARGRGGYAPTLDLYYPSALSLPLSSSVASSPTFSVTTDGVGRRFLQDQRTRGQHRPFEVLVKVRVCAGPTP